MANRSNKRGVDAVQAAFQRAQDDGRCALITYLTLGYPTSEDSLALVPALEAGGADLIELGVPFSDPVADGPTIQAASQAALEGGITPTRCLELAAELRQGGLTVPLLLMGYYNPILSYGERAFVEACQRAGVDGLIVPDLPPEEATALHEACEERGIALVFLVAPNSSSERIARIAAKTSGFLYVVTRLGITGAGQALDPALGERLEQVREVAQTPVAAGFGISEPAQVAAIRSSVDGVIVGSALVRRAPEGATVLERYVASLREACKC